MMSSARCNAGGVLGPECGMTPYGMDVASHCYRGDIFCATDVNWG